MMEKALDCFPLSIEWVRLWFSVEQSWMLMRTGRNEKTNQDG